MTNDRTILIAGVTGNQGGAVAKTLQGSGFRLRGLTGSRSTILGGRKSLRRKRGINTQRSPRFAEALQSANVELKKQSETLF